MSVTSPIPESDCMDESKSPSTALVLSSGELPVTRSVRGVALPAIVAVHGEAAAFAWDEFFSGHLRNPHTRRAYRHAVNQFLGWLVTQAVPLDRVTPGLVGSYFDEHRGSSPTCKLHLAALRRFFDILVNRHVLVLNPAASVRTERYQAVEGKTPEMPIESARKLLASIRITREVARPPNLERADEGISVGPDVVGLRDRAVIATLIYTAARAGAVAKLRCKHLTHDGTQWSLRFEEKGGKSREIPLRHDLQLFVLEYISATGLDTPRDCPLFRSAQGKTGQLTDRPMTGTDVWRMVKRRLRAAGLPARLSPHSFRVMTVTDLLTQGVPLEDVQYLAGHSDPRTTRLYDRRQKRVSRNTVERISV